MERVCGEWAWDGVNEKGGEARGEMEGVEVEVEQIGGGSTETGEGPGAKKEVEAAKRAGMRAIP